MEKVMHRVRPANSAAVGGSAFQTECVEAGRPAHGDKPELASRLSEMGRVPRGCIAAPQQVRASQLSASLPVFWHGLD